MKFSNGCWLNKDGITRFSPQEVYSSAKNEKVLTMYTPCNRINHRGDTLGGPVITYKISSPLENVLRIRSYHYMGAQDVGPHFEVKEDNKNIFTEENEEFITVQSGDLKVQIDKNNFSMEFYNGDKYLTKSENRSAAYFKGNDGKFLDEQDIETYMRDQLSLSVGEAVYGLGERFTPFVKNGQSIDIWNEDGGTSTEQSYKNIPFYITNKGYGVFVNHPERVSFEVGSEQVTKVQFSVPGECLDYYIITGNDMKEVLENYTSLTGKPALPPSWSFGLWLTTSFTTNYDEKTVNEFVDGMASRDIPLHVFHFDCFWMKDFNWCNFEWDNRVFPDPEGMIKRLKEKGLKICVWINPYIGQESSLFEEGKEKGYLIKKKNGDVWQWDMWQPAMAIVDFTNPEACKWYGDKLKALMDMGVDCFKTDFGERIPTNCKYYDGSDPEKMHNYYTQIYNKVVFDVIKEVKGENEAVLFARSATAGGQQFPVHWGGDCTSNYESMAESLRGGLSLCMSGFGFWSHDIGGFESTSTPDVYKRWAAFGLLSSHSRLHGSTSYRVPWLYDEESCDVVRFFTKLKCSIMPYLFKTSYDASTKGIPVMRSMILENQDDPACRYLDRQYMLGDNILVAPIFNEEGIAEYYLPEGKWTNFISGKSYEGGRWIREKHDYLSIPMMVKENSIVAVGANNKVPNYDYGKDVTLEVFNLEDNKEAYTEVLNQNAEVVLKAKALKNNKVVTFDVEANDNYSILLNGIFHVEKVDGADITIENRGVRLTPSNKDSKITCTLK
ncbi:MAG: alpha-xylosidase [Clostridium sp.]|uniref:alpha-xylosidase n=1 Tax=Clostridium sp. TaxID=1506 RepID=UPI001ED4526A|nr:alpha-xylosidase [Clostridium sp.]MBS5884469.1 alpha-xylosidase [Clostridium sp.]MDU7147786.1 alpha-xylosidase [Clostridium sp.]